ncbi:uncharacterized protein LOC107368216 isoform X1 [Tetranychus urticae]|uniref:uncharacterized protein LOC107368216 isoform X1 n=1 Tax=Tetranychus urticae TaxID=32264 RepID=UPI00077C053B|nr:uncharacterized protein LOC107368216 isoform X1 [Tetranychus urticae]
MKGQNTSSKRYSSFVTINHCLVTFLVIVLSINRSHAFRFWWTGPEPVASTTEPPEEMTSSTGEYYTPPPFDYSRVITVNRTYKVNWSTELPKLFDTTPPYLTATPEGVQKTFEVSGELVSPNDDTTRPSVNHWPTYPPFTTDKAPEENTQIFGDAGRSNESPPEAVNDKLTQEPRSQFVHRYFCKCYEGICTIYNDNRAMTSTTFPTETTVKNLEIYSNSSTEDVTHMLSPDSIRLPEILTSTSPTESTVQSQTSYDVLVPTSTEGDPKIFEDVTPEPSVENPWPTVNCHADEFSCHSKRLCIKPHLVCDGINDCDDGSDELMCDSRLQILSSDFICGNDDCIQSYDPDQSPSACGQWDFGNIHVACKYKNEKVPSVVFSSLNALYETIVPKNESKIHANKAIRFDLSGISAFHYVNNYDILIWLDTSKNKIYWTTFWPSLRKIGGLEILNHQVSINGTHQIHGFVYDWENNALIWVDDYGIRSKRFLKNFLKNDQTKLYRTLDPSYDRPGSITIEVKKRFIFWTNIGADPNRPFDFPKFIERIDITDGEPKTQKIVETNILRPVGLVC